MSLLFSKILPGLTCLWLGLALCVVQAGCRSQGINPAASEINAARSDVTRPRPPLVVLIAVDQLITEHLDPRLPGGLGRLAREGRVFDEAAHVHARSETCPGHAVMLTGVQPARAGIPGNRFIVNGTREVRYCVQEDEAIGRLLTASGEVDASVLDSAVAGAGAGRSPRQLRVEALGDWMHSRWPESKVFSVSAKDRAAIVLGGQRPDAAYWLDRGGSGAFTTSAYYMDSLPAWVAAWTRARVLAGLPAEWVHSEATRFGDEIRPDDYPAESARFNRTSPHPLATPGEAGASLSPVEASPWLDTKTLEFARELVEREGLGDDAVPDLLAVSLSATDIIGHHYGPDSREAWSALLRLDADLAVLLAELEARVGEGRLLVALTSDHGVLPIPEWWQEQAKPGERCAVEGGRVDPTTLEEGLSEALVQAFGADWSEGWVRDGLTFGFDAALMQRDGVTFERALAVASQAIEASANITRVWTRAQIEAADRDDHFAMLYRNQLADGRGGELFAQPGPGCLFTRWPSGTSHGSPHAYDLEVPLVFWGPGVEAGHIGGPAAPVDIAPTLAGFIGLAVPEHLDGRALSLQSRE